MTAIRDRRIAHLSISTHQISSKQSDTRQTQTNCDRRADHSSPNARCEIFKSRSQQNQTDDKPAITLFIENYRMSSRDTRQKKKKNYINLARPNGRYESIKLDHSEMTQYRTVHQTKPNLAFFSK
jgi:hypothetical protein